MYSLFNFSISNGQMHQTQGKTFLLKESFLSCKTGMFAVFLQHFHTGKEWKRKEGRLQLYFMEQLQSEVLNIIKTVFSLTENSPQEQTLQHRFYFPPIVPCYSMAYHTHTVTYTCRNVTLLPPVTFLHEIRRVSATEIPKYMKSDRSTRASAVVTTEFFAQYSLLPKSLKSEEQFSESALQG